MLFYNKDSFLTRSLKKPFSLAYLVTFFWEEKFLLSQLSDETFKLMPSKKYEGVRNQGRKKDRSKIFQGIPTQECKSTSTHQSRHPFLSPIHKKMILQPQLLQQSISTNLLAPSHFNAVLRDFLIHVIFMDYMYIIFKKIR